MPECVDMMTYNVVKTNILLERVTPQYQILPIHPTPPCGKTNTAPPPKTAAVVPVIPLSVSVAAGSKIAVHCKHCVENVQLTVQMRAVCTV